MRLSARQREVLEIIDRCGSESWGDVWAHYDAGGPHEGLDFRNFDRVTDAVVRRGLVTEEPLALTPAGREALASPRPPLPARPRGAQGST